MRNPIHTLFRRLRSPLILLIMVYAVSIFGFVLIPGVDDNGDAWEMSFFHAFYFVSFMGTTIGFGEIPYAFTDGQRYWALITMYATVISWLYGIGVMLSVFQDPLFLNQLKKNTLLRRIKNIREPFYIICGYGDTGTQLTRLLSKEGILSVIIDPDEDSISELEADDFLVPPLSLCAYASQSEVLQLAGIEHPWCKGIITIANDDNVNLTVAIVAQLLNPDLRLIARAETPEAEANILSFGANEVINPFETFSSRLALAFESPGLYCLYDWMTGESGMKMKEPPRLAEGLWVICGFGRFGRSLYDHLDDEGVKLTIIEGDRSHRDLPSGSIIGRATEAPTLKKAGVENAVGIIAGSDNDANNLSIILTASELNKDIYRVIRQSSDKNSHLFKNSEHEMLMHRGSIISNTIFAYIRTPILADFLRIVSRFKNERANELVSKIIAVVDDDELKIWEISITPQQSPALYKALGTQQIHIDKLFQSNYWNASKESGTSISAMPLFMKRDKSNILLPENKRLLQVGDRVLMCGTQTAFEQMRQVLTNPQILENILQGREVPTSLFWNWLTNKRSV